MFIKNGDAKIEKIYTDKELETDVEKKAKKQLADLKKNIDNGNKKE